MRGKSLFALSLALFCVEIFLLFYFSSLFFMGHILILLLLIGSVYIRKEEPLYPLLLLILTALGGPFGLASFLLILLLRPIYSRFAVPSKTWFADLFPDHQLTLFEKIMARIQSHWDDYSNRGETSSFHELFSHGSLFDKQKVLDAIIEDFDPAYSPILKEALQNSQNTIRIQAAAIITKINNDFEEKLKKLEKRHQDQPQDTTTLLQIAELLDTYAFMDILDKVREKEVSSLAVKNYRSFLESNPENLNVWLAVARLLFYQDDYQSFIAWFEEGKKKFGFLPKILHSWYLESLYKLWQHDEFTNQLREFQ